MSSGNCFSNCLWSMCLDNSRRCIMHADDQGGRSAMPCDLLNDKCDCADSFPKSSHLSCAHQTQQSCLSKRIERCLWVRCRSVNIASSRSNDLRENGFKRIQIGGTRGGSCCCHETHLSFLSSSFMVGCASLL